MLRFSIISVLGLFTVLALGAVAVGSIAWLSLAILVILLFALAIFDVLQKKHSILRNYPVIGHMRFLMEFIRPEMQQYFIERDFDGRPFPRETRSIIYERAKGIHGDAAYGTQHDVYDEGYEYLVHTTAPAEQPDQPHRVRVGGPDCTKPYDMSLLNVSAMSFGAISGNAILAMNKGAKLGGFAHDTGEGGISKYHLEHGGDLVWEIGSGYFGARTSDGDFDPYMYADRAAHNSVKCLSLKLSQGAKPGIGGVLPANKVTAEIAEARSVPVGEKCISPAAHKAFSTPRELIRFLGLMRKLGEGKPVGFKLCVGSRTDVLAICKAMTEEGITPDFIIVDGSEGGTGAAPLEYENKVGTPLTDGLILMHNALVGTGLRDRIKIGASGKIATGADLVTRLVQGADYTNAARPMMMATGCIQSLRCHTNECPVGVATQDPRRARALDVADKSQRVFRYHDATVQEANQIMATMGVRSPDELRPHMLRRMIGHTDIRSYEDLYEWLRPGQLLDEAPESWAADWVRADPDRFRP